MKYDVWKSLHKSQLDILKGVSSIKFNSHSFPLSYLINGEGNTKLPATTAIFNMSSATECISKRLGLCKAAEQGAKCYALKAEVLYPQVLPYRNRQAKFWKKVSAEDFVYQFLMISAFKRNPFDKLRLNESGDFGNQSEVEKAEKIARILKRHGVITYCYTSRSDLDFSKVRALKISGSGFKKEGIVNIFKIIKSEKDRPKGFGMCGMSCKVCEKCSKSNMKTCVVKH